MSDVGAAACQSGTHGQDLTRGVDHRHAVLPGSAAFVGVNLDPSVGSDSQALRGEIERGRRGRRHHGASIRARQERAHAGAAEEMPQLGHLALSRKKDRVERGVGGRKRHRLPAQIGDEAAGALIDSSPAAKALCRNPTAGGPGLPRDAIGCGSLRWDQREQQDQKCQERVPDCINPFPPD